MAPKSKPAAANGAPKKPQSTPPSGTTSPAPTDVQEFTPATYGTGKPDKAVYDAEQNKIKAEIDAVQAKLVRPLGLSSAALGSFMSSPSPPSPPPAERRQGQDCAQPEGRPGQRAAQ